MCGRAAAAGGDDGVVAAAAAAAGDDDGVAARAGAAPFVPPAPVASFACVALFASFASAGEGMTSSPKLPADSVSMMACRRLLSVSRATARCFQSTPVDEEDEEDDEEDEEDEEEDEGTAAPLAPRGLGDNWRPPRPRPTLSFAAVDARGGSEKGVNGWNFFVGLGTRIGDDFPNMCSRKRSVSLTESAVYRFGCGL